MCAVDDLSLVVVRRNPRLMMASLIPRVALVGDVTCDLLFEEPSNGLAN